MWWLSAYHRLPALAALLSALLCAPAGARAATTIGSDLSGAPVSACTSVTGCTATPLTTGGARPVTAPAPGTLVRFRVKHGPTPPGAAYTLKVLSGSGSIVGGLASFTLARQVGPIPFDSLSPGGIDVLPAGFRIAAGQRIGIFAPGGVGFQAPVAGSVLAEHDADHTAGTAAYSTHAGYEPLINADIELDAARPPAAIPPPPAPTAIPAGYARPRIARLRRPRRSLRSLLRRGLTVSIACHGPCSANATLVSRGGSALGRGRRRTASGGRFGLKVKLTRRGRRVVRGIRRDARLTLRVSASDRWGRSSRRQRITVTRR